MKPTITNTRPGGVTDVETVCEPILVERHITHGDFELNARIAKQLKMIFSDYGANDMSFIHQLVLDEIALKLARLLSGRSNFKEHWDDIAGYAQLASKACDPYGS